MICRRRGQPHRSSPGLWLATAILLALTTDAAAQTLLLQGGSSSLFNAHGGTATVRGQTYSMSFGAGVLNDEVAVGFLARRSVRNFAFSFGDEAVDFELPTDVFGGSRYVPVRAAGMEWSGRTAHARILAGTTSETLGAPFFRGAASGRPIGLLFYDRRFGERWHLFSKTAVTSRPTSIQGISWRVNAFLTTAVAAGIGSSSPYVATSVVLDRPWIEARAGYVQQKAGFRRLQLDTPMAAEPARENAAVTVRPRAWWSFTAGRQTLMDVQDPQTVERQVTVNQVGGSINRAGFRVVGALYDSHQPRVDNRGLSISTGRRVTSFFDVVVDYFRNDPSTDRPTSSVVLRLQESITPRLSLIQAVTRSADQTSINFGGELLTNPLRATVSYQTVYAPLKDGNPFVHVVGVDARLNVLDFMELQLGTYTTPMGQLRYLVSGTYGRSSAKSAGSSGKRVSFQRFIVEGTVQDENQRPVAGAVLQIGDDVVVTNTDGRFFLRTARDDRRDVRVMVGEFLAPGRFAVLTAPDTVQPRRDGDSTPITITVRRI